MKLVCIWFVYFDYNMFDCNVVVYELKCHCWNFSVVVELLEMTQCSCEIVSLNLCFVKYCTYMPRRNTSQIPSEQPELPQDRTDRLRAGRIAPTGSARREKEASRPPMTGRGGTGYSRVQYKSMYLVFDLIKKMSLGHQQSVAEIVRQINNWIL